MILISALICEKKQRLEVARGFTVFTSQFYLLHTIPTQPVIPYSILHRVTGWVGIVRSMEKSLINTGDPLDHLESRISRADYS